MGSTSVGTAYVTIMPSMNGFADKLTSGLDAATRKAGGVGTKGGSSMGKAFSKGFSAKVGAIAGVVSTVASTALSGLAGSVSSAVSRLDTLNNYPKVMTSLGYSAKSADASIQQISDHLDGLPSSTDSLATFVQQIAATGGSLKESTSLGLAFNDMMLAGGKGTAAAQGAMYQFTQILSKGKAQGEDWNSLMETAPGQMRQLATSILGAGHSAQELGEYLGVGVSDSIPTERIEEFKQAIIDLDKNGGKGIASFSEQAKAVTGGVGTAIDNVQVRAGKALATLMETVGQDKIAGAINGFSASFNGIAKVAGKALKSAMKAVDSSGFKEVFGGLSQAVSGAFGDGSAAKTAKAFGTSVGNAVNGLIPVIQAATPVVGAAARVFVTAANNAEKAGPAIAALVVGFKALKNGSAVASSVKAIGNGLVPIASKGAAAGAGLMGAAAGETAAGNAGRFGAKKILACAAAVISLGAGVALAGAGLWLIANAAINIANAGPLAAVAMVAMVGSIALLAVGAAAIGPALTAGAVGMVAFGAAVLLVGAGIAVACAGVTLLSTALPTLAAYGSPAASALAAIGTAALVASPGIIALGAGALVAAAGVLACGAGMVILAASTVLFAAGAAVAAASVAVLAASMPYVASAAPGVATGFAALAAALLAASPGLVAAAASMAAAAASVAVFSAAVVAGAAGMSLTTSNAMCWAMCGALPALSAVLPAAAEAMTSASVAASAVVAPLAAGAAAFATMAVSAATLAASLLAATGGFASTSAGAVSASAALTAFSAASAASAAAFKASMASVRSSAASGMSQAVSKVRSGMSVIQAACSRHFTIGSFSVGQLPHFSLVGDFNAKTKSVPHVNVSWYGKGGVFGSPSVIGVGEAGSEAVIPLNRRTLASIGAGVADASAGGGSIDVDAVVAAVQSGIAAMGFYVDGTKLANATRASRDRQDGRARIYAKRGIDR